MKTLSNLTAICADTTTTVPKFSHGAINRATEQIWSNGKSIFIIANGVAVEFPHNELVKLAQAHEPKLCPKPAAPKPVDAPPKTP